MFTSWVDSKRPAHMLKATRGICVGFSLFPWKLCFSHSSCPSSTVGAPSTGKLSSSSTTTAAIYFMKQGNKPTYLVFMCWHVSVDLSMSFHEEKKKVRTCFLVILQLSLWITKNNFKFHSDRYVPKSKHDPPPLYGSFLSDTSATTTMYPNICSTHSQLQEEN